MKLWVTGEINTGRRPSSTATTTCRYCLESN